MSDLVYTLPAEGATAPPDPEGANSRIADHADRAVDRLAFQFRKPNMEALIRAFCVPVQRLEDALWQLYTERFVDTAIGAQLDLIGKVVKQPRLGYLDADYRRLVKARISVNKSNGTTNNLLRVARLVLGADADSLQAEPQYPATIVIRAVGAISADLATLTAGMLKQAKSGGVRLFFEYSLAEDAGTFAFDGGTGLGFGDSTNPATGGQFAGVI